MENKGIIYEIRSKYILKYILDYIKEENFIFKLFPYSKYFQKKLNISYLYCYKKYLEELHFDLTKYFYKDETEDYYEKFILKKEYSNFITENKLNKEQFENILYKILNHKNEKEEENKEQYINIDSPLFHLIFKIKEYDKYYTIYLSQKIIDEYKLKDDYINIFNELNKINKKYFSLYYLFNKDIKLDYLKEFKILII